MYARQQCEREGEKQLTIWGGGARETQHVYRGATDCGDSANHRRNAPQNATSVFGDPAALNQWRGAKSSFGVPEYHSGQWT